MRYLSPLRYPGGKAKLAPFLGRLIAAQEPQPVVYGEPFAGGVGAGLRLLVDGQIERLLINDINPGIAAFWRSVIESPDAFCSLIADTDVTIEEWHHQRNIYFSDEASSDLELGFATFFLNRTNRSGILSARPIGGLSQEGAWKLDARYNKKGLIARVETVAAYREAIDVTELDAIDFLIRNQSLGHDLLVYVDPPYLQEGGRLYLSQFGLEAHKSLAEHLKGAPYQWFLTYDDDSRIYEEIYAGCRLGRFEVTHTANRHHLGKELIAFGDSVRVPDMQVTLTHAAAAI